MISLAKDLTRTERNKKLHNTRGVYFDYKDEIFTTYVVRYNTSVVTLRTALCIYGIIDDWNAPPYYLAFQKGYRKIKDERVKQFRDDKKILMLGAIQKDSFGWKYYIYDFERLLIEVFRKEKYLSLEDYKQTIFFYRKLVNDGSFNIPKFQEYLKAIPKAKKYKTKFSLEVL